MTGGPPARRDRFLGPVDLAAIAALMALGVGLRLAWFSGFGLADDQIFRREVLHILVSKNVLPDNQAYRFTWWFPTALACRVLGPGEACLVAPVTIASTLGIGLVYVFGKWLWGRPGAVIAALLLVVCPLDFAWSTMMAHDIILSVFSAATILLVLAALEAEDTRRRRRRWILAATALWLAFHTKVSALLLLPAIAVICVTRRARLTADVLCFVATAALLFAASLVVAYVFTGDPFFAYNAELFFQGLVGPNAVGRQLTHHTFWYFPRLLFLPDHLGDLVFSVYPHLLVGLVLGAVFLRLRTSGAVFWWFLFVCLGMQLNVQRAEGMWVAGFRNIRHMHVLVYPIILLLIGYLVALRARRPRLTTALLATVLVASAWQSIATAAKTRTTFADRRDGCRFLDTRPREVVHADEGFIDWCVVLTPARGPLHTKPLHPNPEPRRAEVAAIGSGYLVTGGGREPYYGCPHCIPRASELPAGRWRLVWERTGPPPTRWRPEPLRIWQAVPAGD
jgi:hypothetical protein